MSDSVVGKDRYVIQDFEHATDRIDLPGIAIFDFFGARAFGGNGSAEVRFEQKAGFGLLTGDADGYGRADFRNRLDGNLAIDAGDPII